LISGDVPVIVKRVWSAVVTTGVIDVAADEAGVVIAEDDERAPISTVVGGADSRNLSCLLVSDSLDSNISGIVSSASCSGLVAFTVTAGMPTPETIGMIGMIGGASEDVPPRELVPTLSLEDSKSISDSD